MVFSRFKIMLKSFFDTERAARHKRAQYAQWINQKTEAAAEKDPDKESDPDETRLMSVEEFDEQKRRVRELEYQRLQKKYNTEWLEEF